MFSPEYGTTVNQFLIKWKVLASVLCQPDRATSFQTMFLGEQIIPPLTSTLQIPGVLLLLVCDDFAAASIISEGNFILITSLVEI